MRKQQALQKQVELQEVSYKRYLSKSVTLLNLKGPSQGAAKGVRQKEFDHFFFVFGTLSVTFWSLFVMLLSLFPSRFLPNSFCRTPFAAGWPTLESLEKKRTWEYQIPPENCQKSGLCWASPFAMHSSCIRTLCCLTPSSGFTVLPLVSSVGASRGKHGGETSHCIPAIQGMKKRDSAVGRALVGKGSLRLTSHFVNDGIWRSIEWKWKL